MVVNYPDWATEKQLEGMKKFVAIAEEYGSFEIGFETNNWGDEDDSIFIAVLTWGYEGTNEKGIRKHKIRCGWDYEATWDCYGERVHDWQFIFAGGDATRGMSTEVFFVDLFFYLDGIAETKAA